MWHFVIDIIAGSANPAACSCLQAWKALISAVHDDVCILVSGAQDFLVKSSTRTWFSCSIFRVVDIKS